MTLGPRTAAVIALACALSSAAGARDLFILTAGTGVVCVTTPCPTTATDSGHDVEQLVEDFVLRQGAFSGLGFGSSSAALDYLGMSNAMSLVTNTSGSQVSVQIPSVGFSRTFTGTSRTDVRNQIQNFFEDEGSGVLAKFYEKTSTRTPLALLDGNPRSTTALLARGAFDRFGVDALRTRGGYGRSADYHDVMGHFDLYARAGGGGIDADSFDNLWVADTSVTLGGDFNPGVGLYLTTVGQYRSYDGADIYDAGLELAIPITIFRPSDANPVRWAITPVAQWGGGGSEDTLSGGSAVGGGGVSSLGLNLGPFEVTIADELFYYGGVDLGKIEGISIDTELDQWITRNGTKLAFYPLGAERFWIEGGASLTNFLATNAAVDWYASPFAGVGVKIFDLLRMRIGWESDFGDHGYRAHTGRADLGFEF
jgi:hypothetical protein